MKLAPKKNQLNSLLFIILKYLLKNAPQLSIQNQYKRNQQDKQTGSTLDATQMYFTLSFSLTVYTSHI